MGESTSLTTLSPLMVRLRDTLVQTLPGPLAGDRGVCLRGAVVVGEGPVLLPVELMLRLVGVESLGGVFFFSASAAASKNFIRSLRLIVAFASALRLRSILQGDYANGVGIVSTILKDNSARFVGQKY